MATQLTLNDGSLNSAGALAIKTNGTTQAINITTGQQVEFNDGSASAPSITNTGDGNTGIFFPDADTVGISTGGSERARVDSSGNLGLGVTPSAWNTSYKAQEIGYVGNGLVGFGGSDFAMSSGAYYAASGGWKYSATNSLGASFYEQYSGAHYWYLKAPASHTAGDAITFTQAMTLDASGNLGIGNSSPATILDIKKNDTTGPTITLASSSATSYINQWGSVGGGSGRTNRFEINAASTLMSLAGGSAITFQIGGAGDSYEKARIDSSGNYMVNTTNLASVVGSSPVGSIGNFAATAGTNSAAFVHTHSSNPYGPFIYFNGSSPNNTSNYFLSCNDTTNQKAAIYSSGTFGSRTSTYGGISDIKVKQDIVDASSQWNDIKALQFRKYRFKDDPTGPLQLGLISQEAELVSPGLVFETPDTTMDEEGNRVETGEVTKSVKYSILYMKAVVALQEAMNRIEQLEADVAALKG